MWPSTQASRRVSGWSWTEPTSCVKAPRWNRWPRTARRRAEAQDVKAAAREAAREGTAGGNVTRPAPRARLLRPPRSGRIAPHESVTPFRTAAGGDVAVHARHPAGRHRRLPPVAAVGAARGRLPDHPGSDDIPGGEPGCDDLVDHRTAGAAVRPDAGAEPDVLR